MQPTLCPRSKRYFFETFQADRGSEPHMAPLSDRSTYGKDSPILLKNSSVEKLELP
jgi:hypothetical protein